jgi:carboxyl-terminal processing protease
MEWQLQRKSRILGAKLDAPGRSKQRARDSNPLETNTSEKKYKVWEPLVLSLVAILGMVAGAGFARTESTSPGKDTAFTNARYSGRQVEEIIRFLETKYVGDVESEALVQKAIDAIMQGLDPHTHYFPPDQMDELEERTMGHYVGIGVEIAYINDSLVVLYPKDDSPAERAGLKPGDFVIAINDTPIPNDSLDEKEVIDLIKGKKGTKLRLTIRPMMKDTAYEVQIIRDEIKVPSVPAAYMIDSGIAYIKLDRFINSSYKEFMDHWERMYTHNNARHLVLDLRDNPGGYLKEAVNMLSQMFEAEGKLLVYTEGKNQHRIEYKSTGKVFFPIDHICVLINEGSASASEIIAGCLQDQDRGLVIGSRSYGKGLVQEQFELSNGGILRMTVSKYYTPSGRLIQKAYDTESIVDTNKVFKTESGRIVHAGGGVIPDIDVAEPVNWDAPGMMKWMDIISEYAIRYNLLVHDGELIPVDSSQYVRKTLPPREKVLSDITALALRRTSPAAFDSMMQMQKAQPDQLFRIAESTLVAYRTGEEGWYRAYNEEDPVITKAKEMVKLDLMMALKQ